MIDGITRNSRGGREGNRMAFDRDFHRYAWELGMTDVEFAKWLQAHSRTLDVGCGEGNLARTSPPSVNPNSIVSVDILPGIEGAVSATFGHLPFAEGTCDAAIAMHSALLYGYSEDDVRKNLNQVRRVMKPDSDFLATVHGYFNNEDELVEVVRQPLNLNNILLVTPNRKNTYGANLRGLHDGLFELGSVRNYFPVNENLYVLALYFKCI